MRYVLAGAVFLNRYTTSLLRVILAVERLVNDGGGAIRPQLAQPARGEAT